jgi:hypothetical protein
MSNLLPCPFCGEIPLPMSTGMAGQPRWQHPNNDTCPIAGHYLGGWNMPEQWNTRTVQAQIDAAVLAERERCAKVAAAVAWWAAGDIAALIRKEAQP